MSNVPFMDLAQQHQKLENELLEAVKPLLRNAMFIGGKAVEDFEAAFGKAHGGLHTVGLKSGTAALQLPLEARCLGPEDEVLVPAFTFIATAASVVQAGAKPVFVDVDPEVACMDPKSAAAAITPRTKAMIPVHLYGHPAPMDELLELAAQNDLFVLEDCAQSHLATLNGKTTGTMGHAAAFSFYPAKNMGAGGDGGAAITPDQGMADLVRQLMNHGRIDRYHHAMVGWNERMDAIQAAILSVKLKHLPKWTKQRQEAATRYHGMLEGIAPFGEPLKLPTERAGASPVYHLYVLRHSKREEIGKLLGEMGIGTGQHYPMTVPEQPAFQQRGLGGGSFPVSEDWARTCFSLPFFPEITVEQQEQVVEALRKLPS